MLWPIIFEVSGDIMFSFVEIGKDGSCGRICKPLVCLDSVSRAVVERCQEEPPFSLNQ